MNARDEEILNREMVEAREDRADLQDRVDRAREMSSWRDEQAERRDRRARLGMRGGVTVTLAALYADVAHAVSGARNTGLREMDFPVLDGEVETFNVGDILAVHEVRP